MNIGIRLVLFAPLIAAAAVASEPLAQQARSRFGRLIALFGLGAALGGSIALLVQLQPGATVNGRGLELNAAGAALAAGIALVAATSLIAGRLRAGTSAPLLAAVAAGIGSVASVDVTSAALFFVATSVALGVIAFARSAPGVTAAFVRFALADVAVAIGLLLGAGHGLRVPPDLGRMATILVGIGAAVRCGVLGGSRWIDDVIEEDPAAAAIVLGAGRIQAFVLASWIAHSTGSSAEFVMVGAALIGAYYARRAFREASAGAALCAHAALVIAGLSSGSVAAGRGASLLIVGSILASVLVVLGVTKGEGAPTLGAAPLGASLPGAAMIAVAFLERGSVERWVVIAAAGAGLAVLWLVMAGIAGLRAPATGGSAQPQLAGALSTLPVAAGLAIWVLPASALTRVGLSSAGIGVRRGLGAVAPAITDRVGVVSAVVAVIVLFVVAARVPARRPAPPFEPDETPVDLVVSRPLLVGIAIETGAIVVSIALVAVGISRGFL